MNFNEYKAKKFNECPDVAEEYEAFGPQYAIIRAEIETRRAIGLSQKDLADVLGVSPKEVNFLLQNKQSITFEIAQLLEKAFGISAQTWLNHELRYRESKQKCEKKANQVKIKSPIYEYMPINEMVKKGWLTKVKKAEELAKQEMSARDFFFEFDALGELPGTLNGITVKDGTIQNKYPVGAAFVAEYSPTGFGRLELKAPSSAANGGVLEEYNKKVK